MAKKKNILDFYAMKESGEKIAWVTSYDVCVASYAEAAGIDMILIGDSMGMIVYGFEDGTIPVTMDMCINHCQAVKRGAPNTYIVGDMPFGSYQISTEEAVANAVRFVKEGGVDAIKLEGGVDVVDKIKAIVKAGIVVCGHVGLTPQSSATFGGHKAQGRTTDSARSVIEDAIAVYKAGAKLILLEGIPEETGGFIHKILPIPVLSIGAGADVDGQLLVVGDLLGMFQKFTPKFAKKYCDLAGIATDALTEYVKETKAGTFPAPEHNYKIKDNIEDFQKMFAEYEAKIDF